MIVITENTPEQLIPSLAETSEDYEVYQNPWGGEGGLVHKSAEVGKNVQMKAGSIVMENAKIRDGVLIGENVVIGAGAWVCRWATLEDTVVKPDSIVGKADT